MIYKITTIVALCVLSIFPAYASDTANQVIETARKACALEKGTFNASSEAIKNVDLNADGKPDEIIDEGKFSCSTASSLYCGTGGCMLHLIVDNKDYKLLSQVWTLAELGAAKIVITAIHWSECNYKTPCLKGVVWLDRKFRALKQ
jgi:hypothetical protein